MKIAASQLQSRLAVLRSAISGGKLQIATDGAFTSPLVEYTNLTPTAIAANGANYQFSLGSLSQQASATGNAEAWRILDSSNNPVISSSSANAVTSQSGGGELTMQKPSTAIEQGETIEVNLTIRELEGV